jgi:ATP-binding cassette subfamily B protein
VFDVVGYASFAVGGLAILLWVDAQVTLLVFIPIVVVITLCRPHAAPERARQPGGDSATAGARGPGAVQAIQVAGAEDR